MDKISQMPALIFCLLLATPVIAQQVADPQVAPGLAYLRSLQQPQPTVKHGFFYKLRHGTGRFLQTTFGQPGGAPMYGAYPLEQQVPASVYATPRLGGGYNFTSSNGGMGYSYPRLGGGAFYSGMGMDGYTVPNLGGGFMYHPTGLQTFNP